MLWECLLVNTATTYRTLSKHQSLCFAGVTLLKAWRSWMTCPSTQPSKWGARIPVQANMSFRVPAASLVGQALGWASARRLSLTRQYSPSDHWLGRLCPAPPSSGHSSCPPASPRLCRPLPLPQCSSPERQPPHSTHSACGPLLFWSQGYSELCFHHAPLVNQNTVNLHGRQVGIRQQEA